MSVMVGSVCGGGGCGKPCECEESERWTASSVGGVLNERYRIECGVGERRSHVCECVVINEPISDGVRRYQLLGCQLGQSGQRRDSARERAVRVSNLN